MMKRFYYGAMATGLVFTACSSDNLSEPGQNGPSDVDKTVYVKMSIHGDVANGTRTANDNGNPVDGTDFADGEKESEVKNAYFVFYDANGKMVGDIVQITLSNPQTSADGNTVEKYYQNVIPVSIKKGETSPAQVVCYINPITPAALQNHLDEIQTVTRENVTFEDGQTTYFPMSNSVYYSDETATEPQIAVPVDAAQLYKTADEAKADNAQAIDVYVERYASKLAFKTTEATDYVTATASATGDETEVKLSFVAERWALNAEANNTYVVKSFRESSQTGILLPNNYSFVNLNGEINKGLATGSWIWNNANYHRSYWSVSPAYFTEEYPQVAGDIKPASLHQKYYTYADLSAQNNPAGFDASDETAKYFRETTVGQRALESGNPAAAMPSVILVGSYKITVGGTEIEGNPSFYTYLPGSNGNPLVFFEAESNSSNSAVANGVSMLQRFFEQTTVLYKSEAGKFVRLDPSNPNDVAKMFDALEVKYPSDEVRKVGGTAEGEIKVPARQRTLQFKNATTANESGIYVANGSGYKQVVADDAENIDTESQITLTDANRVLMQQVGFANYYHFGHAYFNIPVKHYGWYRAGNEQKDAEKIDWNRVRVGDFGMVRNHSYEINVSEIKGLATGIGGEGDYIVPPSDTQDYYVAYKVRILKWAVVPVQNVKL